MDIVEIWHVSAEEICVCGHVVFVTCVWSCVFWHVPMITCVLSHALSSLCTFLFTDIIRYYPTL